MARTHASTSKSNDQSRRMGVCIGKELLSRGDTNRRQIGSLSSGRRVVSLCVASREGHPKGRGAGRRAAPGGGRGSGVAEVEC